MTMEPAGRKAQRFEPENHLLQRKTPNMVVPISFPCETRTLAKGDFGATAPQDWKGRPLRDCRFANRPARRETPTHTYFGLGRVHERVVFSYAGTGRELRVVAAGHSGQ